MNPFDVLDRSLAIHRNYLLEASAGTGKTFSIQNIVVRLLIEQPIVSLNKILVVTFTRAATRDLRLRIHANIEGCLGLLNQRLNEGSISERAPDYLKALMEKDDKEILQAKRLLQQALFTFDQASIFTIHSFCSRMLKQYAVESDMGFHSSDGVDPLPNSELRQVMRDFFRTGMRDDLYSPTQLSIILKKDPKQVKLLRAIKSGGEFALQPTYRDLFVQFIDVMQNLKRELGITAEILMEDFDKQIVNYKKHKDLTNEQRRIWAVHFSSLFDKIDWEKEDFDWLLNEGLLWHEFFDDELLKVGKAALHDPFFDRYNEQLRVNLVPLIHKGGDFTVLLARLARDCLHHMKKYQSEEERISPDDLLVRMDLALNHLSFAAKVRGEFTAAIIDEFQDTDPLQWKIFKRLFVPDNQSWEGHLYLVGDPKQSIYSFRQADIYTYLAAAEAIGRNNCFTLDVNYRSQPCLVQALNTLFDPQHVPNFMPLPKKNGHLTYQPVKSAAKNQPFQDDLGAIHFFMADITDEKKSKLEDLEQTVFFPFIVQQISRLTEQKNFTYSQFAVLVRDRFQALRLTQFFDFHGVPYLNQKGISLANSGALTAMIDVVRAILHPHDRGAVKTALGSPILGWDGESLMVLEAYDPIYHLLQQLRHRLIENGFASFFEDLLLSQWKRDGVSVAERLLGQKNGIDFYHDLRQIADVVIEHHFNGWNTPEGLIAFLDNFEEWSEDENEKVMRVQDPNKDGVKIITLHYSKGLEFDVVFALGLIKRDPVKSELIPVEVDGRLIQTPLSPGDPLYLKHCREVDAEKMRQLYVALTRAKYQLYIPLILNSNSTDLELGAASPLDLLVGQIKNAPMDYNTFYEQVRTNRGTELMAFLNEEGKDNHITYSIHQEIVLQDTKKNDEVKAILYPPRSIVVGGEPLIISSFTGLSRHQSSPVRVGETLSPPHDFGCTHKHIHSLPSSSETGIFIHSIMEQIDFSDWKKVNSPHECLPFIEPFVSNSSFVDWKQTFAALTFNALKTQLWAGIDFCLADLQSHQLYREMPFLFSCNDIQSLDELIQENGLIKGVIDLIFTFNDKYYIVDWKSNWLGDTVKAYEPELIAIAMQDNSYFLQATIYSEALKRYLKLVDPRPFEECFGGTIYLFMRGMNPGSKTGIYHSNSTTRDLCNDRD